jgi:protein ImuB
MTRPPADGPPPWPGRLPAPAPATVVDAPGSDDGRPAVEVLDADGAPVRVTGRGLLTVDPARLDPGGPIAAWAGPWPLDERWWDPSRRRRRARLQVVTADGVARLLSLEDSRWWVEAVYD